MPCWEDLLGKEITCSTGEKVSSSTLAEKEVVALYFSAHWCPPCRGFTPQLAEGYKKMVAAGKSFEVVFVSSDKEEAAFDDYFKEMPWAALPYAARDVKAALSKKFKVSGIPALVLLDSQANVITLKGREAVGSDLEGTRFPWKPPTFFEALGTNFVNKAGETATLDQFKGKTLGLYFSAHWCPPCRAFTPQLAKTYTQMRSEGKWEDFEVIFVSSDKTPEAFTEYLGDMPWWALPYPDRDAKAALSSHFDISGIPSMVIVGPDGKTINANARQCVVAAPEECPWPPKPVGDFSDPSALNEATCLCLMMEGVAPAQQKVLSAAVEEVAKEVIAKEGDDRSLFFYAQTKGDPVCDQIRKLTSAGEARSEAQVILLNIPDDGGFYVLEEEPTADALRAFLAAFAAGGKLTRKQLG